MNDKILLEYIQGLGLTNEEFAKYIDVSYDTLKTWLYRTKEVPKKKVDFVMNKIKLHQNYTTLKTEITNQKIENSEIMIPKYGLKAPIPYYNVDFAGGWESEEIFSIGNPDFYISNPEFDRAKFACNLVGNSISRRIPNRSIIGLKLIEDWQTYFPTNELYGVVMKNELRTVKIVKRSKENKNLLILIPDPLPEHNQIQFEPEEVPIEFVSKFYQIVAWAQFERIAQ